MGNLIYNWIDIIWLPIAFLFVHKQHRWWAAGFIVFCMTLMRLQTELMEYIGYPTGILPFIESHVNARLMITYSLFYIGFLILAHFSPKTQGIVFLGACLAILFMIFTVSSLIMLL